MTPKHVVFLTRRFYPHIGGVETHVLRLSEELVKHSVQITVITEQHDASLPLLETYRRIKIVRIPYRLCAGKWGIWRWMLRRRTLFRSAYLVHAHDVYWWYFPLRLLTPRMPSYVTFHGWEGVFPPERKAVLWRKAAELCAKKNICIGSFIERWYGTKADKVVYGAVDIPKAQQKKSLRSIAFFGRLDTDNDVSLYVEAFRLIKQTLPSIRITFVGDGAERQLAESIGTVTGIVKDPAKHIRGAAWLWSSSYLSMMQGMAMQQIVCSLYGNPLKEDYVRSFPVPSARVAEGDPRVFARVFTSLYRDMRRQNEMKRRAFTWVKTQTWEHVAKEYLDLWQSRH